MVAIVGTGFSQSAWAAALLHELSADIIVTLDRQPMPEPKLQILEIPEVCEMYTPRNLKAIHRNSSWGESEKKKKHKRRISSRSRKINY